MANVWILCKQIGSSKCHNRQICLDDVSSGVIVGCVAVPPVWNLITAGNCVSTLSPYIA